MTLPLDAVRAKLGKLAQTQQKVGAAGANIKRSAEERMAEIDRKLDDLRPATMLEESARTEYQELIQERGRLALVLGG